MTGGEIVGAGAVGKGVGEAIKAAMPGAEDRTQFREITRDARSTQFAAHSRADRVAIVQMAITKLFAPLARWVGYKSDYFDNQFSHDMAEKLADVPDDRLISPTPIVAAQAMEGLGYSLDEPDLKEMYLNLLATASDSATASNAHPSFAQIIKQLSATEAKELLAALESDHLPFVNLRYELDDGTGGGQSLVKDVYDIWDVDGGARQRSVLPGLSLYLDNWERLGLVSRTTMSWLADDTAYEYVTARPEYTAAVEAAGKRTGGHVSIEKGILRITAFGEAFIDAVTPASVTSTPEPAPADPAP